MANPQRGTRFGRARNVLGATACAATISLVAGLVSPAANGQSSASGVSELVTAVSRAQADVDALNLDLGGLQESVNQSLVDLHDAQVKAEQARRGKDEAKRRLNEAQERVDALRAELDDLSRSQYRGASPSDALVAVSGKDTQRDVLDRSLFLRQRSEEKRAKLAEAEEARAEAANEEATLRQASELADASEAEAKQAEASARELLDANRAALEASVAERDAAQSQLDTAQKELDQQRPAQTDKAQTDKAQADQAQTEAEADATQAQPETPDTATAAAEPDNSVAADPYAATLTVSKGDTTYEVPEEVVDLVRQRVANDAPEAPEPSRATVIDAVRTVAQTSSDSDIAALSSQAGLPALDSDTIAKVGAVAAGIAMVGGVAANHGSFDNSNADAVELVTAFADGLNGALGTVEQTSDTTETADSTDSLSAVLPEVETAADVSAKSQKSVAAVSDSSQVEAVIARAQSQIGTPYVWGGGDANGPTTGVNGGSVSGFDCSGLVLYAFAAAGVALPHYTGYQYQRGTQVPASEAQRGDLLFWGPGGNQHVAIYLGDGTMIEAPQSGQNVTIAPVRWSGMAPNAVRLL